MAGDPKPVAQELLALCFSKTAQRELVTREFLTSQPWEVKNGVLALEAFWRGAKTLPGFDGRTATPALCQLKQHERRLGLIIELPAELRHLTGTDIATQAGLCPVKRDEVERVLAPLVGPDPSISQRRATLEAQTTPPPGKKAAPRPNAPAAGVGEQRRKITAVVAVVLSLGAVVLLGTTLYGTCGGGAARWKTMGAADVPGLPVKDARRLGNQLEVTVDEGWFAQPETTRRGQLEAAYAAVRKKDIDVLAVKDGAKKVRATAQMAGTPPSLVIRFR